MSHSIPRLVLAGAASGAGKTTAAVALVRALRNRGLRVAVFKVGPDYMDPTYLARAAGGSAAGAGRPAAGAGAPAHNLDGWMMGRAAVRATLARASAGADIAVIEGMMGLFDGLSPRREEGSTAELAKWLSAPVLLLVDASGMARTIAAVGTGFARFDPALPLAGLLCNGVGSRGHLDLLREAAGATAAGEGAPPAGVAPPVLGGLPHRADLAFSERHLGLHAASPAALPEERIAEWGALAEEWFDIGAILEIARAAPP